MSKLKENGCFRYSTCHAMPPSQGPHEACKGASSSRFACLPKLHTSHSYKLDSPTSSKPVYKRVLVSGSNVCSVCAVASFSSLIILENALKFGLDASTT
jgi:hypothetical protein